MNGLRGIAGDGMQTVTNTNALCEKIVLNSPILTYFLHLSY